MKLPDKKALKIFLDKKVDEYDQPSFINSDPICIPHSFSKKQDIEIAGFFAAIFAWGNRTTIINKSRELMRLMDNAPHQFILTHEVSDLKRLMEFKHRTFNTTDLLYFIEFFKHHYSNNTTLESAFFNKETILKENPNASPLVGGLVGDALNYFYNYFFSLEDSPSRTVKHIASPQKKSTCKRLNMFLRWMVRKDKNGVDFGLWKKVPPAQLVCPIDVHVARVARHFRLLDRKPTDWQAALELTVNLRSLDERDPVKYDFALFGLGVMEKF
ncbi:MAG TPA: TIGR02757 family protein [Chitinophagaceae bacterium]|nr:TIGR02757 family protein [Chitinophagaceae bacterium]